MGCALCAKGRQRRAKHKPYHTQQHLYSFLPAEDESMDKIIIRPMTPEDWGAVSRIYVEGIATEYATFQTECPPYTAWDASHTKECRLVILSGGVLAGWCALHRVDPRGCYRGVA